MTQAPPAPVAQDSEDEGAEEASWDGWDPDQEDAEPARSLLEPSALLPGVMQAVAYDRQRHGLDFLAFRRQHRLDLYSTLKAINWLRRAAAAGTASSQLAALPAAGAASDAPWGDDSNLQPALEDDAWLFFDWEEADGPDRQTESSGGVREGEGGAGEARPSQDAATSLPSQATPLVNGGKAPEPARGRAGEPRLGAAAAGTSREAELAAEVAALQEELRRVTLEASPELAALQGGEPAQGGRTGPPRAATGPSPAGGRGRQAATEAGYFDSYGYIDIHHTMLTDKVRTEAYRDAIEGNPALFRGATVLDVGAGTGILSMFAARAGATRVLAVEGSAQIARTARALLRHNRLDAESGGPVQLLEGRLEELPPQQVDVIVSEWMGYALLFEGMLASVLHARDRWLRPGGAILPDRASVCIAAADDTALDAQVWRDMYGFDFSPVWEETRARTLRGSPPVQVCPRGALLSAPCSVHTLDLLTLGASGQDFTAPFTLRGAGECHVIVLWFEAAFSPAACKEKPVTLSTSPSQPPTHWAQTLLLLERPVAFGAGAGPPSTSLPATAPSALAATASGAEQGQPALAGTRQEAGGAASANGGREGAGVAAAARAGAPPSQGGSSWQPGGGAQAPQGEGELRGRLSMARSPNQRGLEISLEVEEGPSRMQVMSYRILMEGGGGAAKEQAPAPAARPSELGRG